MGGPDLFGRSDFHYFQGLAVLYCELRDDLESSTFCPKTDAVNLVELVSDALPSTASLDLDPAHEQ